MEDFVTLKEMSLDELRRLELEIQTEKRNRVKETVDVAKKNAVKALEELDAALKEAGAFTDLNLDDYEDYEITIGSLAFEIDHQIFY